MTPFVCLCVWHVVNSAIVMPQTAGLTSHCNTRDMLPTRANDLNSHTNNASQTSKCKAVNQSNLQLPVDVTADILDEVPHDFLIANMHNLDWSLAKHEPWIDPNQNAVQQSENRAAGLWIIIMAVFVLLDEVQLSVIHKMARLWACTGLIQVLPRCRQGWPTKWIGRFAKGLVVLGAIVSVVQSKELDSQRMSFMGLWIMQMPKNLGNRFKNLICTNTSKDVIRIFGPPHNLLLSSRSSPWEMGTVGGEQ